MPRAGLSRDAVTDIAVELADVSPEGFEALTLAAVAARAGVAVPSLYKHVGGLADLRRSVALVGMREVNRRISTATVGLADEDALRALGREFRAFAREHPGLYAAAQFAPGAPDALESVELVQAAGDTIAIVAAVLRGFGLPDARTVDAVRATRATVHGFIALENGGGFGLPDSVDASFEALLDMLAAGVRALARA